MKWENFKWTLIYCCLTTICIYHLGYSVTSFFISAIEYNCNGIIIAITGNVASFSGLMFLFQELIISINKDKK